MTVVAAPHLRHPNNNKGPAPMSGASKARLFLAIACFWPIFVLAMFAASAPQLKDVRARPRELLDKKNEFNQDVRFNFRKIMDRVDVMGYGPTHPRIAVVIVGSSKSNENILSSVKSLISHTSLERIFQVVVVVDGVVSDPQLEADLKELDSGESPHFHGLRADMHKTDEANADDKAAHGSRIQVLFNEEKRGIAESRLDAVEYIHMLSEKHEKSGLKSPQEDLLLLLLQSGAQFENNEWLVPVTGALIVPAPPIVSTTKHEASLLGAMKLANAVVFNTEGTGKRTSFDLTFTPTISDANAAEINGSEGNSYATPVWNGGAMAMRLNTYRHLPGQDVSLTEEWPANLELSLNLWLCADGIDQLQGLNIQMAEDMPRNPLTPEMTARFAAAWMEPKTVDYVVHEYTKKHTELTHLEFETLMSKARGSEGFPIDLTERCRSFIWYAQHVNTDIAEALDNAVTEMKEEEERERKIGQLKEMEGKMAAQQQAAKDKRLAKEAEDAAKKKADDAAAVAKVAEEAGANGVPDMAHGEAVPEGNGVPDMAHGEAVPEEEGGRRKPTIPLRANNLEFASKPKPVDITFADISGGHQEHPHLGAKDENGDLGYIHDETALRLNPPAFSLAGKELTELCSKRDLDWKMLNEKVVVDFQAHKAAEASGKKRDKIFCLVYTIESGHGKIPAIRETWGPHCDGFMVGSTKTNKTLGTVEIPHEGEEDYNNIWQKVRSMWSYIYDNYYETYDWFHIGGDDLLLMPENLRLYLESDEIKTAANGGVYLPYGNETTQTPLFLGRRFAYMGDMNDIFISGGSGYTMNKAAFKLLVTEGFPNYFPHAHTFSEDTMVAKLLRKFDVHPYDTKDEEGGERYMPFMPGNHYQYKLPPGNPMDTKDWYAKYSIDIKEGPDHCSAQSVAFHYVKGKEMWRLYALMYHMCPAETL